MLTFWKRTSRVLAWLAIAATVWIIFCDALPIAPESWQVAAGKVAARLGIGQGHWSMFTPPDRVNHRLRWELTLRDGQVIEDHFPDLTTQSLWQRFAGHRRSEYVDNAITVARQHPAIWEALASDLVRNIGEKGGGVAKIRIIVALAEIPDPSGDVWDSTSKELIYDDERVVYRRKFP